MASSGGGGGSSSYAQAVGDVAPMSGVPIAGQGTPADPADFGRFQSFLPQVGSGASATGLTPDMMQFRTPSQIRGGQVSSGPTEAEGLRAQLAAAIAAMNAKPKEAAPAAPAYDWTRDRAYEGGGTM